MLIATHLLGLCLLLASAVAIFRTYCEGFGCMGIGVMWLAWAGAYAAWLLFGSVVLSRAEENSARRTLTRRLLTGQGAVGLALFAYWAIGRFS